MYVDKSYIKNLLSSLNIISYIKKGKSNLSAFINKCYFNYTNNKNHSKFTYDANMNTKNTNNNWKNIVEYIQIKEMDFNKTVEESTMISSAIQSNKELQTTIGVYSTLDMCV